MNNSWTYREVITVADDDGRENQDRKTYGEKSQGGGTRALPLVQAKTPQCAEDHDARHVDRPAREVVRAHLRFTHGVEEELHVPRDSGQRTKQIILQQWNAHGLHQHRARLVRQYSYYGAVQGSVFASSCSRCVLELRGWKRQG